MGSHVFVALGRFAFGETTLGVRLAEAVHARGEQVAFLAPASLAGLLRGAAFRHGTLDSAWAHVDAAIAEVARATRADRIVLVDAASVCLTLAAADRLGPFLDGLPAPVVALDVWDLPRTDRRWDLADGDAIIPAIAATFPRRLVPVPFARPEGAGRYCALPELRPLPAAVRSEVRALLGLPGDAKIVLTTTARWQTPQAQLDAQPRHLAARVPEVVAPALLTRAADVWLLHVGPERWPIDHPRYRWLPQLPATAFARALGAADLLLTLNTSASTIGVALASDVPILTLQNSHHAADAAAIAAVAPQAGPDVLALAPLHPFRVWPLGLHRFLAPVLADNPYADAIGAAELLALDDAIDHALAVLRDPPTREAALVRQRAYVARVSRLPSPADAYLALASS